MQKNDDGGGYYRIGDLNLDTATHQLRRGEVSIALPPLSYRLFLLLVERAPAVVSHDEIAAHVWAGRLVSPETLTQRIKLLRHALEDDAREPRYIALVRGEGYRLIADVAALGTADSSRAAAAPPARIPTARGFRRRALAALGLIAVAATALAYLPGFLDGGRTGDPGHAERIPREKSVAVLPFTDMSSEGDRQYLGQGIADELLHRLGGARELRVIARTSSFALGDSGLGAREIAGRLGVRYVLQGSIRDSDGALRVTAQLVDALDDTQLWSEAYDRRLGDILSVQHEIAASLSEVLEVTLADGGQVPPPRSPDAYRHFMLGDFFFKRRGHGDMERAEESFRTALAADPTLARAWVGLAGVSFIRFWEYGEIDYRESIELQRSALKKAIALDPDLAEAHIRLFNLYWQTNEKERAEAHFSRARELDPYDPLVLGMTAGFAHDRGDLYEALELSRQGTARDPLSALAHLNLAVRLVIAGRLAEADAEFLRAQALSPSLIHPIAEHRARIRILQLRYDEALRLVEETPPSPERDMVLAVACERLGRHREADEAVARLNEAGSALSIVRLAEIRTLRGESDAAQAAIAILEVISRNVRIETHDADDALMELQDSPFLRDFRRTPDWRVRLADLRDVLHSRDQG
ncbi:MAG: winged helix-turn-helix domain-containing protein [Gammaproteobacteria bacterium]